MSRRQPAEGDAVGRLALGVEAVQTLGRSHICDRSPSHSCVDLSEYRESELERERIADLLELSYCEGNAAIDVGTRDGYFARLLADRFQQVIALDVAPPPVDDKRIACIAGDVRKLAFADNSFDLVVCAEVLEHIPPRDLAAACAELSRITRGHLLVGVPYKQDTRVARTTCARCGAHNPPWGHVNCFDEPKLRRLFPGLDVEQRRFVGINDTTTNFVASFLMNLGGNPYGTSGQDEPCVRCGASLTEAPVRRSHQKVLTRMAFWAARATQPFKRPHPNWIHVLFRKRHDGAEAALRTQVDRTVEQRARTRTRIVTDASALPVGAKRTRAHLASAILFLEMMSSSYQV